MRESEMKTLNIKRWLGLSALLGSLLVVAGCSLAPTYAKPDVSAPAAFKEAPQETALGTSEQGTWKTAQPSEQVLRGEWWTVFNDPTLNDLEHQALEANQNLKAAEAAIDGAKPLAKNGYKVPLTKGVVRRTLLDLGNRA